MKTNLIGLAVAAAIVTSFTAFADDWDDDYDRDAQPQVQAPCEHPAEPAGYTTTGYQAEGQYVSQNVQQWVPGRYDQVYVPICGQGRWGQVRCHGGSLQNRWIPGYYTTVQEMVWVPAVPRPQQYGVYQGDGYREGHRHYPMMQGRGVHISFGVR